MNQILRFLLCTGYISFSCWGAHIESDDLAATLRREIDATYETVMTSAENRELGVITRNLNLGAFPILPTSHRFEQEESREGLIWSIKRHRDMPEPLLGLYVFGRDAPNGVNYVVQIDGKTTYSYAHPRREGDLFEGGRNRYEFKVEGRGADAVIRTYLDGHCIDQADTAAEGLGLMPSHLYAVNRIPEPKNREGSYSHWGQNWRKFIVDDYRVENKCYAQWVMYDPFSTRTTCGVAVPRGILFMGHTSEGDLSNGWAIPWDSDIHREAPTERGRRAYRSQLREFGFDTIGTRTAGEIFFGVHASPARFTYIKNNLDPHFDHLLRIPETYNTPYDHFQVYRMETLADGETLPQHTGLTFEYFLDLLEEGANAYYDTKALYWGARFRDHVRLLQTNDARTVMVPEIDISALRTKVRGLGHFDSDHSLEDELRQIQGDAEVDDYRDAMRRLFQEGEAEAPMVARPASIAYGLSGGAGCMDRARSPLALTYFRRARPMRIDASEIAVSWRSRVIAAFLEANAEGLATSGYEVVPPDDRFPAVAGRPD